MSFAIDIRELRERAELRAANAANPANRLTVVDDVSRLATLATSHTTMRAGNTAQNSARPCRYTPPTLTLVINRCCDARGDDDANRQALIEECVQLSPAAQADLIEHFAAEAIRCKRANGTDETDERSGA